MLSMPPQQIAELCNFASVADKEARSDLSLGYISGEDDYTSNFTGALRRIINSNSSTGLSATSFVLQPRIEQRTGCDATILISSNGHIKIAMFEAKLPRFGTSMYRWDYAQTASGLSHFSDQLTRQARFWPRFAIFEMFYCELPFGQQAAHLQSEGSSCTWHDETAQFDSSRSASRSPWTQGELDSLLQIRNTGVGDVLASICQCDHGTPMSMWGDAEAVAQEFSLEGPVLHIAAATSRR
ncbi:MAG: hypothetical protein KF823_02650 [Xanthomonadales bacterium]|nr:hypothetical protein [Xanthomonadales bacterium]